MRMAEGISKESRFLATEASSWISIKAKFQGMGRFEDKAGVPGNAQVPGVGSPGSPRGRRVSLLLVLPASRGYRTPTRCGGEHEVVMTRGRTCQTLHYPNQAFNAGNDAV